MSYVQTHALPLMDPVTEQRYLQSYHQLMSMSSQGVGDGVSGYLTSSGLEKAQLFRVWQLCAGDKSEVSAVEFVSVMYIVEGLRGGWLQLENLPKEIPEEMHGSLFPPRQQQQYQQHQQGAYGQTEVSAVSMSLQSQDDFGDFSDPTPLPYATPHGPVVPIASGITQGEALPGDMFGAQTTADPDISIAPTPPTASAVPLESEADFGDFSDSISSSFTAAPVVPIASGITQGEALPGDMFGAQTTADPDISIAPTPPTASAVPLESEADFGDFSDSISSSFTAAPVVPIASGITQGEALPGDMFGAQTTADPDISIAPTPPTASAVPLESEADFGDFSDSISSSFTAAPVVPIASGITQGEALPGDMFGAQTTADPDISIAPTPPTASAVPLESEADFGDFSDSISSSFTAAPVVPIASGITQGEALPGDMLGAQTTADPDISIAPTPPTASAVPLESEADFGDFSDSISSSFTAAPVVPIASGITQGEALPGDMFGAQTTADPDISIAPTVINASSSNDAFALSSKSSDAGEHFVDVSAKPSESDGDITKGQGDPITQSIISPRRKESVDEVAPLEQLDSSMSDGSPNLVVKGVTSPGNVLVAAGTPPPGVTQFKFRWFRVTLVDGDEIMERLWEIIGSKYLLTDEDVGHCIRVHAMPKRERGGFGRPMEATSNVIISYQTNVNSDANIDMADFTSSFEDQVGSNAEVNNMLESESHFSLGLTDDKIYNLDSQKEQEMEASQKIGEDDVFGSFTVDSISSVQQESSLAPVLYNSEICVLDSTINHNVASNESQIQKSEDEQVSFGDFNDIRFGEQNLSNIELNRSSALSLSLFGEDEVASGGGTPKKADLETTTLLKAYVDAWNRIARTLADTLMSSTNVWIDAVNSEIELPFQKNPKGRYWLASLSRVLFVSQCLITSMKSHAMSYQDEVELEGLELLQSAVQSTDDTVQGSAGSLMEASLAAAIALSLPGGLDPWSDPRSQLNSAFDALQMIGEDTGRVPHVPHCALTLLPLACFKGISTVDWKGKRCLTPVANWWANMAKDVVIPSPSVETNSRS